MTGISPSQLNRITMPLPEQKTQTHTLPFKATRKSPGEWTFEVRRTEAVMNNFTLTGTLKMVTPSEGARRLEGKFQIQYHGDDGPPIEGTLFNGLFDSDLKTWNLSRGGLPYAETWTLLHHQS